MRWVAPENPRRLALVELARVEPIAASMLADDRLVHGDGLAVTDGEARGICPVGATAALITAELILDHRGYLASQFGLSRSCVLFHAHHTREVRRLLVHGNAAEAHQLLAHLLASHEEDIDLPILREIVALLGRLEDHSRGDARCARHHRGMDSLVAAVFCVFTRAWDEAWALDAFGSTTP